MKFVSFTEADGPARVGVIDEAGMVVDCAHDAALPYSMIELIAAGPPALERCRRLLDAAVPRRPLVPGMLLAPIPRPVKNVFCVGRNYIAHVEEGYRSRGEQPAYPEVPQFFTKAPTAVIGPDTAAAYDPDITQQFDYEAELGIVIGRGGRNIPVAEAASAIFGYTIVNDFTARDLQRRHGQWFKGKSLDRSCAIGPWIVPAPIPGDPQDLAITLSVNGEQRQASRTSRMIFPIARIVAELSRGMTLEPGDIIATGTPEGVGYAMDPPRFLDAGDEVRIDIEHIGTLINTVEHFA